MHYGVCIPNFGVDLDAQTVADLAHEAEEARWDGFFLWDHLLAFSPGAVAVLDPWITLTAIALRTQRIRLGTMVTPLPRRRPTTLARQTVTLDRHSHGRLTLGVGSGALPYEWEYLGEQADQRVRGAMLDEGLAVLTGLWTGDRFSYRGTPYRVGGAPPEGDWQAIFYPPPLQQPRIPIWVGGTWPRRAPFRRAARWDGVCPTKAEGALAPREVQDIVTYVARHRVSSAPFDVVIAGATAGDDPVAGATVVAPYVQAGATWWIEGIDPWRFGWTADGPWPAAAMAQRIRQGPPRA